MKLPSIKMLLGGGLLLSFALPCLGETLRDFKSDNFELGFSCSGKTNKFFHAQFQFQKDYSSANQLLMIMASKTASDMDLEKSKRQLNHWGFDKVHRVGMTKSRGAYAYVAKRDEMILVAVRGTNSRAETFIDMKFIQRSIDETPGLEGHSHWGFYQHFLSLKKDLDAAIPSHEQRPIFVTGHSLGAATAVLVALYLKHRGGNIWGLYTSAQPIVGDATLQEKVQDTFGSLYHRVILDYDITTQIPPPINASDLIGDLIPAAAPAIRGLIRMLNYSHPLNAHLILSKDGLITPTSPEESSENYWHHFDPVQGIFTLTRLLKTISGDTTEHSPSGYLCRYPAIY